MFVPVIISKTSGNEKIINRTIVYKDTILDLKEKGKNLCVTKIKVDFGEFEKCVNSILDSNQDAVFNTIQYSHKYHQVFFYTDRKISISNWENRNVKKYEYMSGNSDLIDYIEEVFKYEDTLDRSVISAFDVFSLYKRIENHRKCFVEQIEKRIDFKLKNIQEDWHCLKPSFKRDTAEVECWIIDSKVTIVWFRKMKKDLYIYKQDGYLDFDVLPLIGAEIEEFYDYSYKLNEKLKSVYFVESVNSKFSCDFTSDEVRIKEFSYQHVNKTILRLNVDSGKCSCDCNSNNCCQLFSNREKEFASKVMVPINKCPESMQSELRKIRKQQIDEIYEKRRIKEEQERIERERLKRKQKRREFLKKIFSFIK